MIHLPETLGLPEHTPAPTARASEMNSPPLKPGASLLPHGQGTALALGLKLCASGVYLENR